MFQKTGSFEEKIDYFYMAKTNNDDNNSRERNQSFNLYANIRIRTSGFMVSIIL